MLCQTLLLLLIVFFFFFFVAYHNFRNSMAKNILTLESVRHSLIRQEDSIIFSLIERAHFPINSPTYSPSHVSNSFSGPLLRFVVKETEALLAKVCMRFAFHSKYSYFNKLNIDTIIIIIKYINVLYCLQKKKKFEVGLVVSI